jgi:hypothetical protein
MTLLRVSNIEVQAAGTRQETARGLPTAVYVSEASRDSTRRFLEWRREIKVRGGRAKCEPRTILVGAVSIKVMVFMVWLAGWTPPGLTEASHGP